MVIPKRDKSNDEWRIFVSSIADRLPDGSWGYMGFKSDKWKNMHQEKYRNNRVEEKFDSRCDQLVGWNIHSYCCPHAFSYGERTVENLYALQSIVLDIDCHSERYCKSLKNQRVHTLAHILLHDADDYGLPEPNYIVFTGRGLQIWWNHESMSARKCLNTWKSIVRCFIEIVNQIIINHSEGDSQDTVRGLSVDEQASLNPVGLFRIPGTYNPKAKTRTYSIDGVNPNYIYTYKDLVRFRNDYRAGKPIVPQKSKKRFQVPGYNWNVSSWANSTALKIEALRDLRNAEVGDETRNNFCLALYALYRSAGIEDDSALERLRIFNDGFKHPMTEKELKSTLSTARRKLYQYSTKALIQLLDISEKEAAIIGIKYESKQTKPDKKAEIKERNKEIIRLYKTGLTQAQVGDEMGLSRKVVGEVLRNAGIDRSGDKARKVVSLHRKGLSIGQIADKIGCTIRNIYRILENAASKDTGGAPEAAQISTLPDDCPEITPTSTNAHACMSEETCGSIDGKSMNTSEGTNISSNTQPQSASTRTLKLTNKTDNSTQPSGQENSIIRPEADFSSQTSEGLFPSCNNNGYLPCKGERSRTQGRPLAGLLERIPKRLAGGSFVWRPVRYLCAPSSSFHSIPSFLLPPSGGVGLPRPV